MIGFELSEEQREWRDNAKNFAEKEIAPLSWKIDKGLTERFHWSLIEKMGSLGFMGLGIPKKYGGCELDTLTTAIVIEELAVGDAGIAFTCTLNSTNPVMIAGSEKQKDKFLPAVYDKKKPQLSAFALTEPNAGSDAAGLSTLARKEGSEYVLNGEKCFISNGDMAGLYTIMATVDKKKGFGGITAFVVPGNAEGLIRGKIEDKMGFRSSHTGVLAMHDVRVPEENVLGKKGEGFLIAMRLLEVARVISCGAVALGLARRSFETTLKFLKDFADPKSLIGQQAVSFDLADMMASIEASRLLVWKSCWMIDNGIPVGTMSGLTKVYTSDMALEVSQQGMGLVGLHAYSKDYPLEKQVRDAKTLQIYEGTNQINRMVAARGILEG